ncbi:replication initiation and membrane attachment family protein [Cytobacillus sp. FJAT-54145]|uniref:Replication initiation and membrane attachment family protein n=1 Tax=Cytobacillus spartinae TaxID=3299023 RepID=A0ABW6KLN7_9BACI
MTQHWQKLQPGDRYVVSANGLLHDYDRRVLISLYQPLVGLDSSGLYMTLWCELEENRLASSSAFTHRNLMTMTSINLKDIYAARLRLEGIGLLKTYVKETEGERLFIYELQPPASPEDFFNDGLLNIYLYRKIGETQYLRLKKAFSEKVVSKSSFSEETKAFEEVYESISPDALQESMKSEQALESEDMQLVGRGNTPDITKNAESFIDIDFIIKNSSMIPAEMFTPKLKRAIGILSFVYGVDAVQMKNMVLDAFDPSSEQVKVDELRIIVRNWYQVHNQNKLPSLVDKIQPPILNSLQEAPKNEEEEHVYYLETTSPRQLLIKLSGGAEPSVGDLNIIEEIMDKQKLTPGVTNVLIEYALIKNDMKLTRAYLQKIASHWARKKIVTAKEAMELARSENQKYQDWTNRPSKASYGNKKSVRKEAIPDWYKNQKDEASNIEASNSEDTFDFELEKRKLEEELKEFKKER